MTIAVIGSLVMFQVFQLAEGQKRSTTGVGDAQQNGAFALFQLERVIRSAGSNLTTTIQPGVSLRRQVDFGANSFVINGAAPTRPNYLLGCQLTLAGSAMPVRVAPVLIGGGASGSVADSVTVFSGTAAEDARPHAVNTVGVGAGATTLQFRTAYGVRKGDWLIVTEQSYAATLNGSRALPSQCSLVQVTNDPTVSPLLDAPIDFTPGLATSYTVPGAFNIGPNPIIVTYSIANGQLLETNLMAALSATNPQVIADGIVNLQAQYGFDINNDDLIDEWSEPPGGAIANAANNAGEFAVGQPPPALPVTPSATAGGLRTINQIKGLRLAIVARSQQVERPPEGSSVCTITPVNPGPALPGVAGNAANRVPPMPDSGVVTLAGSQLCYRYKVFDTIIPIRNMIWSDL